LTDAERLKAEENVKSALSRFGRAMIGEQQWHLDILRRLEN
jgi:hypothetical protein